jgi:tetratricopeptide (TPR) repeat protein/predicted Ser/Thr protein kinase
MTAAKPPREDVESQRTTNSSGARTAGASQALLEPGQLIAERFLVERLAGTGGMGVVYSAQDLATKSRVAVKVVGASGDQKWQRFAREARLLAEITHPAVVRYVAHGLTLTGAPFLAMEWLEGEDLAMRLGRSGLKVEETLTLMRRVCAGLSAAHDQGVVHRDLKPANLFLVEGRPEAVKLLDFGVARLLEAPRTLTRAGSALGTVGYMAPEQAMGVRDIDARADVFALGCVLFECLAGRPPFEGPHDIAVLAKVLREEVPRLRDVRPDAAESLDELVACLLAKDRGQRPRDARAVLAKLEKIGNLEGSAARPTGRLTRPEFVDSEQHIASVVLARARGHAPATLPSMEAAAESEQLEKLSRRFNARPVPLRAGNLLLVFGATQGVIASDQAAQAVRCALALRSLKPELEIGVGTGSLATALNASVGLAIDRASALLDDAERRELPRGQGVQIDALTAGLLHGGFVIEQDATSRRVVREVEEVEERARLLLGKPSPCVGREKELGLLEATLSECSSDQVARALLVTAEPGAGKSRLGREFFLRVRAKSQARCFVARADPSSMRSPLHVLSRLLRQASGVRARDSQSLRGQRLAEYLSATVEAAQRPFLLEFLGELLGVTSEQEPSALLRAARSDPAVMREQTRRAVQHWLVCEVTQMPVVIMLDDLQWVDLPSLHVLEDAVLALREQPIFLLALARPEARDQLPDLFKAFGSQELRLTGLTRRAAERLVREMLPDVSDPKVVAHVVDLADGNAFYLEELIRRVAVGDTELPETVRAIVRSRLDVLPPDARRQLRVASVFGETSWVGGVKSVLGGDVESDVESWFALLAREEIFVRRQEARFPGEVEYTFRHALLRDAAYAMLSEEDRRSAHAAAGGWLETMGERDPSVLAAHFERSDDKGRARGFLLRAAQKALWGGDLSAALTLSRRGLSLGASGRERGELLLVQAHASAWGTRTNLDLASEALELLPRASGSWWFSLSLLVFGSQAVGRADLAESYLELAKQTPPPVAEQIGAYGQAFEVLALGAVLVGRPDIGWSVFEKFRALVEAAPDCVSTAWLHLTYCQLATNTIKDGSWQLGLAVREGRAAVSGMQASGAVSGEATALLHLGIALREAGCYGEAEQAFTLSQQKAKQVDNVLIGEFARLMLSVFARSRGALAESDAELEALCHSTDVNIVHLCQGLRAQALLRSGQLEHSAQLSREAAAGPGLLHRITASLTLAQAELALGRAEQARAVLADALKARGEQLFPQLALDFYALLARVQRALHDEEAAQQTLSLARRFANETADAIEDLELHAAFARRSHLAR